LPAWALVAAASIAAAAGVGAVALASGVLAVIGGAASAVTALLALDGRLARDRAATAEAADGIGELEALLAAAPTEADPEEDPIRVLFESGPPAGSSGLLDERFIATTLRGRLAVARRSLRPLAIVCLEALETEGGSPTVPVADEEVTRVLRRTLRESDVAGRAGPGAYVCILEDTGEDGAVWSAERLRRNLVEGGQVRRFRAGVAAYPAHGLEAEELEAKARAALEAARDWATDRIEVAPGA
jgi:hypothetical protein